ncbi:MATE family Na+-driven efflux transporter [Enterobacter sp.]|uniref:MATE family Na+-driven efflux transporter n=1 Tax=Enterobacter sp. TaxID=42895 RepID=UPI00296E6D09|nr:MATE family Na+-driven efflux transporter [Enterobacter sp.]
MDTTNSNRINYKLWLTLILINFVPQIYTVIRIHLLGTLPDPYAFSIAAQSTWLGVGYEILSETLLIPLFFILGQVIHDTRNFSQRANVAFCSITLIYFLVTVLVILTASKLVSSMQQQPELLAITTDYIRLESVAILLSCGYTFLNSILILKNQQKLLYSLLVAQTLMTIACDFLFVSQYSFSFNMGVIGIAISNIAASLALTVISIFFLYKSGVKIGFPQLTVNDKKWLKQWLQIGWKSGLESTVRNAAFIIIIFKMVNEVQQAGTYWLANQFIWGWLLLPVLALGQLIKQDSATGCGMSSQRISSYLLLSTVIAVIWLITSPLWTTLFHLVTDNPAVEPAIGLVRLMIGFYIIFALNNVIDSYFYGTGRTDLMLYQSLFVNIIFYGVVFALYHAGVFVPTLERIAIMFGLGMAIDALVTFLLYLFLRTSQKKTGWLKTQTER